MALYPHGKWPNAWPSWAQHAFALGSVLFALAVRELLNPVLGDRLPFVTLFMVLLPLALLVRSPPFFVSSLVGLLGSWFVFLPPRFSFSVEDPIAIAQISLYALTVLAAGVATWLANRVRREEPEQEQRPARQERPFAAPFEGVPGLGVMDTERRPIPSNDAPELYAPVAIASTLDDRVDGWLSYDELFRRRIGRASAQRAAAWPDPAAT